MSKFRNTKCHNGIYLPGTIAERRVTIGHWPLHSRYSQWDLA
jgi:hypothetical protein